MSAPSSTRRRRTTRPWGPVWCVTSVMPSIFEAMSRTSSMERASFTPPPLPRPPAWIWAFTTHTGPPSFFAASTASSTEKAGKPRGVATPYLRKSSLPWYSWMFMWGRLSVLVRLAGRLDLLGAAIPLRIEARDGGAGDGERVAAVELEGLAVGVLHSLARHRLERRGGERARELGDVGAPAYSAQQFLHALLIAWPDGEPHEELVGRDDLVTVIDVGHRVHRGRGVDDVEGAVDRDAKPHAVHRIARLAHARGKLDVPGLGVDEVAFDVVEPVPAPVAVDFDRARVQRLARNRGLKPGHRPMPGSRPPCVPPESRPRIRRPSGSAARSPSRAPCRRSRRPTQEAPGCIRGSPGARCSRSRT